MVYIRFNSFDRLKIESDSLFVSPDPKWTSRRTASDWLRRTKKPCSLLTHHPRLYPRSTTFSPKLCQPSHTMSTESNFRQNLSQFRWARGVTDDSQQLQQPAGGPFGRFYNAIGAGNYIPLRSGETSNEQEAYFALSRWERCVGACLVERCALMRYSMVGCSDSLRAY